MASAIQLYNILGPTNQDLSNDTTFSQIKSRVPVPIRWAECVDTIPVKIWLQEFYTFVLFLKCVSVGFFLSQFTRK